MSVSLYQSTLAMRADAMGIIAIDDLPRRRSPRTTNKDRILADLLAEVDTGLKTVHEADAAYGRHPRGAGRPRRFATFADYLLDRIRFAECPDAEQRLRDLLVRAGQRAAKGGGTITRRINWLLARTGSARAEQLREWLAEIAEPAGVGD